MVAEDFMQSEEFRAIGTALEEHGHNVRMFLANGKPPTFTDEEVERSVAGSDFVLLAVSNSFNETLRAGQCAISRGVPLGIYAASGPDCFRGTNLEPLMHDTRLLFVFNEAEMGPAQKLFPIAQVVASGSPNWERFFFPEKTRDEARVMLGINNDEICILVPGDKGLILNIILFALAIEAAREAAGMLRRRARVVIGLHPGDPNDYSLYTDLGKYVPENVSVTFISRDPKTFVDGVDLKVIPTPHALPAADMVVTFVSTLGYEAACQRIPVICFFPAYGAEWLKREAGLKPGEWEQCRNLTAIQVDGCSAELLARTISALLIDRSRSPLRSTQEEVYPAPPEKGSAVKAVVNALEHFQS